MAVRLASNTTNPVRSYSDVAASRPSSPATDDGTQGAAHPIPRSNVLHTKDEVNNSVITTSVDRDVSAATKVHHNNESSLSDPIEFNTIGSKDLTKEQGSAVKEAKLRLTKEQKQKISRCYENALKIMEPNEWPPSHGKGLSNRKGKGPDPKNWGAADLSDSDLKP
ncbi:uncharacterized protein LACBIDRAFT_322691 [Laccaria bicolor S238N-H82]|uniref:Predicted protein n=1 Tax=Laccaria bicolor (strain S238N-H82 / ATCC MYA-4686) TaxID=486041 RepID=B0CX68_LACBS|nr:uncharacterized protein LACBIDRAFT_322691 [Laccaria bicolor S238N-H82]EDR13200.1 predicted protein [Laccaria bicolor S238N-H82]|eukprot:XP_001875698.1 predicted protein [Laccaria bicolor S238N-H82]